MTQLCDLPAVHLTNRRSTKGERKTIFDQDFRARPLFDRDDEI